jgi:hypothetical protein
MCAIVGLTAHRCPITERTWVAAIVLQDGSVPSWRDGLDKFFILITMVLDGNQTNQSTGKLRRKTTWLVTRSAGHVICVLLTTAWALWTVFSTWLGRVGWSRDQPPPRPRGSSSWWRGLPSSRDGRQRSLASLRIRKTSLEPVLRAVLNMILITVSSIK